MGGGGRWTGGDRRGDGLRKAGYALSYMGGTRDVMEDLTRVLRSTTMAQLVHLKLDSPAWDTGPAAGGGFVMAEVASEVECGAVLDASGVPVVGSCARTRIFSVLEFCFQMLTPTQTTHHVTKQLLYGPKQ